MLSKSSDGTLNATPSCERCLSDLLAQHRGGARRLYRVGGHAKLSGTCCGRQRWREVETGVERRVETLDWCLADHLPDLMIILVSSSSLIVSET